MEKVPENLFLLGAAALKGGNEIFQVDMQFFQGCHSLGLWDMCPIMVVSQFWCPVVFCRAGGGVAFQKVGRGGVPDWHVLVSQVRDRLRIHSKVWCNFHKSYWQGQVKTHKLLIVWAQIGDNEGYGWCVFHTHTNMHLCVGLF